MFVYNKYRISHGNGLLFICIQWIQPPLINRKLVHFPDNSSRTFTIGVPPPTHLLPFIGGESVFDPRRNSTMIHMVTGHTKRQVAETTSYQIVYYAETGIKNGKLHKTTRKTDKCV